MISDDPTWLVHDLAIYCSMLIAGSNWSKWNRHSNILHRLIFAHILEQTYEIVSIAEILFVYHTKQILYKTKFPQTCTLNEYIINSIKQF